MAAASYEQRQQRRLDRLRRQRRRLSNLVDDCIRQGASPSGIAQVEKEARRFAEALARALVIEERP